MLVTARRSRGGPRKSDKDLSIKVPLDLRIRCWQFGHDSCEDYEHGKKDASLKYATHGIERDPKGQANAKMAECAFCLWAGLDPWNALDWSEYPDDDYDTIYKGVRVDVKRTSPYGQYLFWPYNKGKVRHRNFDAFVLVAGKEPRFSMVGWVTKSYFQKHYRVNRGEVPLHLGDKYIQPSELWDMHKFDLYAREFSLL